jgi:hypothetical protein
MVSGDINAKILGKFRTIELAVGAANNINLANAGDQVGIVNLNNEFVLITYEREA